MDGVQSHRRKLTGLRLRAPLRQHGKLLRAPWPAAMLSGALKVPLVWNTPRRVVHPRRIATRDLEIWQVVIDRHEQLPEVDPADSEPRTSCSFALLSNVSKAGSSGCAAAVCYCVNCLKGVTTIVITRTTRWAKQVDKLGCLSW